ncbi:MAG TPA: branched chain amino acid ABC transporter substrate-binding protein [Pelotomaculum sp.]|nr:branched chain amino acid ABC transporter substrate-binding protein [Pelotomaculum sp.]
MQDKHKVKVVVLYFLAANTLLVILFALLAGCSDREERGDIVIGVAWPFAAQNDLFQEGVWLAADEINNNGGINGRKVRLVEKDDGNTVTGGMAVAQSFTKVPNLTAVIGHRTSSVSITASATYENAGMVMLSPASTAPALTQKGYQFIFRNIPSDDEATRQLALFAAQRGLQRIVIYYSDDSYGIGLANSFEDHAKEAGMDIVDRFSYYAGLKDLQRLCEKWKALEFDGIFVARHMPDGAEFIANAAKLDVTVPFFAGNTLDTPQLYEIAGKAAEGTVVCSIFNPQESRAEVKSFVDSFRSKYGVMPTSYAAQGYDALNLLAEAVQESGSASPDAVAQKLRTFKDMPGVAGFHTFADNGDDIGGLVVKKVLRNGQFEYIN